MSIYKKIIKKAFTLVELVVVIAIIAILAGVSVAVYFGITNRAKQSADTQIISQLNTQLRAKSVVEGKNTTCYDAYIDALEIGFDLTKMHPQHGDNYVWDEVNDLFAVTKNITEIVAQDSSSPLTVDKLFKQWIFVSEISSNEERSQFLTMEKYDNMVNVQAGFDAGVSNKLSFVNYSNENALNKKDIIIRC